MGVGYEDIYQTAQLSNARKAKKLTARKNLYGIRQSSHADCYTDGMTAALEGKLKTAAPGRAGKTTHLNRETQVRKETPIRYRDGEADE